MKAITQGYRCKITKSPNLTLPKPVKNMKIY